MTRLKTFALALLSLGGLAAAVGVGIGVWHILPSTVPQFPAQPAPAVAVHRTVGPTVKTVATVSGPYGFQPVSYTSFQGQLSQAERRLKMTVIVPSDAYPGTQVEETYISSGSVLNIIYSNMVVMESPDPILPYYKPMSSVAGELANGTPTTWDWIPGSGGGPNHRLLFEEDGTYVRLQLYDPPLTNTLASAEHVADEFGSLASVVNTSSPLGNG
ncbi:MAG: hypothetical protein C7B45_03300 [Sulfobacillus acidophilus]|uniref:Uncharacterized protein n=1 Tax=Sulfobacillus acidophilus TaxID=53633 RepID=A0A2T2WM87_9FIRM|nr:MAG: hypothetical protein C7B45_03300 [Sulfobacillus acidophilus]